MGIGGKPRLLMRLQDGQSALTSRGFVIFLPLGCFGFILALRRALVLREIKNFWPSGRPSAVFGIFLAFGKAEFFCPSGRPSAAPQDKKIQPFLRPKISQIRPTAGPQAKNS